MDNKRSFTIYTLWTQLWIIKVSFTIYTLECSGLLTRTQEGCLSLRIVSYPDSALSIDVQVTRTAPTVELLHSAASSHDGSMQLTCNAVAMLTLSLKLAKTRHNIGVVL